MKPPRFQRFLDEHEQRHRMRLWWVNVITEGLFFACMAAAAIEWMYHQFF